MDTSRRYFVKRACVGAMCFCGFSRMANAQMLDSITRDQEIVSSDSLSHQWILELLTNLNANLNEEECRRIIKSASVAHYETGKMEEMLNPYKGKLDEFIYFIEKEWNWKCHYANDKKVLFADENKPYCVCPLVHQEVKGKYFPALCYCSEGFAERMFSFISGHQVTATVISSVQRGDAKCIYKIEL